MNHEDRTIVKAVYIAIGINLDGRKNVLGMWVGEIESAKSVFPTVDSLLKMLYLAMMDITKKWTGRRQDWSMVHAQLAIYFAERMPG